MPKNSFYITTPIYYVNDVPHIGTAYCTVAADVQARFQRLLGKDVFFLTGTDENATKVAQAARAAGKAPQEFCDDLAERFRAVWRTFHVSYDDFLRTTEERHKRAVRQFAARLYAAGDIYQDAYEGWYCVPDETFYREEELKEGKSPVSGHPVEWVREPCFYFRLSAYQQRLLDYFRSSAFLQPPSRAGEVLSFTAGGLWDISISRRTDWGIGLPASIPGGEGHVVYVWFDALINYLSGIGYGSDAPEDRARFERFWPADVHLVGKDIYTRFHCTLWPAMLLAAGLPPPRAVFGHGFWNIEGRKMSKSFGNVIEPVRLAQDLAREAGCALDIAVDAIRYFLFREVTFGLDGDFQHARLIARFNSDLANDLGNLVNRVLGLVSRYAGGRVPPLTDRCGGLREQIAPTRSRVAHAIAAFDYTQALAETWELIRNANRFVDLQAPWRLAKEGSVEQVQGVLRELLDSLQAVALLISPFMPTTAREIAAQIGGEALFPNWTWQSIGDPRALPEGLPLATPRPIFPRITAPVTP